MSKENTLEERAEKHARKSYWDVKSMGIERIEEDVAAGKRDYIAGAKEERDLILKEAERLLQCVIDGSGENYETDVMRGMIANLKNFIRG